MKTSLAIAFGTASILTAGVALGRRNPRAMYVLLAKREERDAEAEFGDDYRRYAAETPAFIPHLARTAPAAGGGTNP